MTQPIIREAIVESLKRPRAYRSSTARSRLYPSDAGGCKRSVMLRVRKAPSNPFPLKVLESMSLGVAYEDATATALKAIYGDRLTQQLELKNEFWSGKADFVIDHETENAVIAECKATGDKWFDYKGNLPHRKHVIQVALYGVVYKELYGIDPRLILFYRSWGGWAEFEIVAGETSILASGLVNGEERQREYDVNLKGLMGSLQFIYGRNHLPGRVNEEDQEEAGCTFRGEPSCGFYGLCWPRERTAEEIESSE